MSGKRRCPTLVRQPDWNRRPEAYYQGILARLALEELGRTDPVQVDHVSGRTRARGEEFGIIYPQRWFDLTAPMVDAVKPVRFLFIGYGPKPRQRLLHGFAAQNPGTIIEITSRGRCKGFRPNRLRRWDEIWDGAYYERMGQAEFGLCPHHPDWRGPWERMWTYRFIECCLVGAIPVCFRATPLAKDFTGDVCFVWDDEPEYAYDSGVAHHNRRAAERQWRLGP